MKGTHSIGERIKISRWNAGYQTASKFCAKFEIPHSTYSQHESGSRIPNDKILRKYAEHFGVNFQWLKSGEGEPLPDNSPLISNLGTKKIIEEMVIQPPSLVLINEKLLALILEELMSYVKKHTLNFDAADFAKAQVDLYGKLLKTNNDTSLRREGVQIAVNMYFEYFVKHEN